MIFAGIGSDNFIEIWWQNLMRTLDPGTMSDDQGWILRLIMLIISIMGIIIVSILISIISNAFRNKIDEIRRGRSPVLESNHTLIIRWSPKIFTIISELITANENQKNQSIVILGEEDRIEMEEEIRSKIPDKKTTKIFCRSGRPLDPSDLAIVNPNQAKSIIIISPGDENPDTHVIKSVLAITNNPHRKPGKYHIVTELKDEKNLQAAQLVGKDEVTYVLSYDVIAKVTAQTSRQPGLSVVYSDILDYAGDEIYFQLEPKLIGKKFREALFAYEDSAVIGIQTSDERILINPPSDYIINNGDKIIAISEDDDTVTLSGFAQYHIDYDMINPSPEKQVFTERILILGWNYKGTRIITELDNYVLAGSEIIILAEIDYLDEIENDLNNRLNNLKAKTIFGRTTHRPTLDEINVKEFDHIIILSYINGIGVQESDAQTLICLLHLRNIAETSQKKLNIVSEMLDVRNKALAEVARPDDFIVSEQLISYVMAQISENKYLKEVFDDLFNAEGSEIYIRPVSEYIKPGIETNFYTILESAAQKNEIAIGYRIEKDYYDFSKAYGINLNPLKSKRINLSTEDKIIVIAEEIRI